MAQIDSKNITAMPVVSTRRRFLSQAADIAAGGTVLALATIPPASAIAAPAAAAFDPVYDLIAAHRKAYAALLVALKEQTRLERIGDPLADSIARIRVMPTWTPLMI